MGLPSLWQNDVNAASLVKVASSAPEMYVPLWWYSGAYSQPGALTAAGQGFVRRGTTGYASVNTDTSAQLHSHNANWSPTAKFAFEAALLTPSSSYATFAELWDMTTNSVVVGSAISTTSTTFTVVRSNQVTLTPGHVYGITYWNAGGSNAPQLCDASLIVFP